MKRTLFVMTIVAMFAMMISCGEESNIGNGAKLSSTYNKILYDDSSTVIVHEAWTWEDNYLKQIEYYDYDNLGEWVVSLTEKYSYNDKNQLARIDYKSNHIYYCEFEYVDDKISNIKYYDKLGHYLNECVSFIYTGDKVTRLEFTYGYKMNNRGFNPIKMLLTEDAFNDIKMVLDNNNSRGETDIIDIEWDGDNVSKIEWPHGELLGSYIMEYEYSSKLNPYYNLFTSSVLLSYASNSVPASKNVVTRIIKKDTYPVEYIDTIEYTYRYEGDYPVERDNIVVHNVGGEEEILGIITLYYEYVE